MEVDSNKESNESNTDVLQDVSIDESKKIAEEKQAKTGGWTEKDSWKGKPESWIDAEKFNERGTWMHSVLKDKNKRLEEQNKNFGEQIADLSLTMNDIKEHHKRVLESERKKHTSKIKELEELKLEAVEAGDITEYKKIEKQIEVVGEEPPPPPPEKKKPQKQDIADPEVQKFIDRNNWFLNNAVMADDARNFLGYLESTSQGKTLEVLLMETENHIKAKYQDMFTNPKRNQPQMVESNDVPAETHGEDVDYSNLPSADRAECDRTIKELKITKKEWLRLYNE